MSNAPPTTNDASEEPAGVRLARYLREFVRLRTTTVRDVSKYEAILWLGDMPQEPECYSPAWSDGSEPGESWLAVRKQQFARAPDPPEAVVDWVDTQALKKATEELPALRASTILPDLDAEVAEDESPPLKEVFLVDYPEVTSAYERYRPKWEAWAIEHRRREAIQHVYAQLFSMHTQVRKQGEIVELVLGLGLLNWKSETRGRAIPIRRHVVTASVDLHFEAASGLIRLECSSDGAQLRIEDDMLEANQRPDRTLYASVQEQLASIDDDIWDQALMHAALKSWAAALAPDTQWSPSLKQAQDIGGRPVVSFAPALILRKRSQASMVRLYDEVIDQLSDSDAAVPPGWGGLVADLDDRAIDPADRSPDLEPKTVGSDVYFPLPANREQRRIVQSIHERRGVLVQGPPGTGKSHTIANLVCDLLAKGKRVLITAETGRALQVLKRKLPEEIQPLCVSLLGQGGDAFGELNAAVQGITTRQAAFNLAACTERVSEVDRELDLLRRNLASTDSELLSLREGETCPHSRLNGSYTGTASKIAERVAREREVYGWLQLSSDASDEPPLRNSDLLTWLGILRKHDDQSISDAKRQIVGSEVLPSPAEFGAAVGAEREARDSVERLETLREHPAYAAIAALPDDQRESLSIELRALEESRRSLARIETDDWFRVALRAALSGHAAEWRALRDRSHELLTRIENLLEQLGNSVVSIPDGRDPNAVRSDAQIALSYLESGGNWKRFLFLTPAPLKEREYLRAEVLIDGHGASTVAQLRKVCDNLDLESSMSELIAAWADYGGLPGGSEIRMRLVAQREHVNKLASVLAYADGCLALARRLGEKTPSIPEPDWLSGEAQQWLELLEASEVEVRYRAAATRVDASLAGLRAVQDLHDAHVVVSDLSLAVENRDVTAYSESHAVVLAVEQARRDSELRSKTEKAVESAVPGLAAAVLASLDDPRWDDRLGAWEEAWQWAIVDTWLRKRTDFAYQQGLWRRRHETERKIGNLLAEASALRAWRHFFDRLTTKESAALRGWRETVLSMGKGTGRSARMERLRREARQYMDQCRDAIPVWIMPRYLVAEMIDPAPDRYDLVIVDEASQLGIESLFLFYIAKKMIVVGDDQQISPYGVGIADESIAGLQQHFLDGIPHHSALSAQSSLYGNAKIRFGSNIVLREHFRCMPEIIQFSNDLCYASNGTPLDPLRSYPANRLKPLVLRHVADGYRVGGPQHAQNPPEADAIVAQIVACMKDRRYDGLTMGVISLQGTAQARLIEQKILGTLEPEVIEERRLISGDAYAFQGDERDVIFLSLVAAKGETRIGALSGASARQRFNVAASRARDQLWLFHTAVLDELSETCMRYRLLGYMIDPVRETTEEQEQKFDSQFERDVYGIITGKGYHVRTQVCVGDPTNHRYRIDLVVEGMQGRLAVECDGDEWHGADRYEHDMARQRDLERAGWQFVHIRGGDFYRDRTRAMEPLWEELDRLGIKPGGIDAAAAEPPPPATVDVVQPTPPREAEARPPEDDANLESAETTVTSASEDQTSAILPFVESPRDENASLHADAGPSDEPAQLETRANCSSAPYRAYEGETGPDPRNGSPSAIANGLRHIIEVEGPMLAKRAYDVYLRGCGIQRMGREIKKAMNRGLNIAVRRGQIVSEDELGRGGLLRTIVRKKGTPPVVVRERGPRVFEEIPPSEVQTVARRLTAEHGYPAGSDEHLRAVLDFYELKRLTTQVGTRILEALEHRFDYVENILGAGSDRTEPPMSSEAENGR